MNFDIKEPGDRSRLRPWLSDGITLQDSALPRIAARVHLTGLLGLHCVAFYYRVLHRITAIVHLVGFNGRLFNIHVRVFRWALVHWHGLGLRRRVVRPENFADRRAEAEREKSWFLSAAPSMLVKAGKRRHAACRDTDAHFNRVGEENKDDPVRVVALVLPDGVLEIHCDRGCDTATIYCC